MIVSTVRFCSQCDPFASEKMIAAADSRSSRTDEGVIGVIRPNEKLLPYRVHTGRTRFRPADDSSPSPMPRSSERHCTSVGTRTKMVMTTYRGFRNYKLSSTSRCVTNAITRQTRTHTWFTPGFKVHIPIIELCRVKTELHSI